MRENMEETLLEKGYLNGLAGRKYPKGKAPKRKNNYINVSKDKLSEEELLKLREKCTRFILNSLRNNSMGKCECTGLVSTKNLRKINFLLKKNISRIYLVADRCRHIDNRHGIGNEKNPRQIPITELDYRFFVDVIENPLDIDYSPETLEHKEGVDFVKKCGDGMLHIIFAEIDDDDVSDEIKNATAYKHKIDGIKKTGAFSHQQSLSILIPLPVRVRRVPVAEQRYNKIKH